MKIISEKRWNNITILELRETNDYKQTIKKIQNYPHGFKFTLKYSEIHEGKANALKIIMEDCIKQNLLESVSIELTLEGTQTVETFVRI